jgi:hypothetical protein
MRKDSKLNASTCSNRLNCILGGNIHQICFYPMKNKKYASAAFTLHVAIFSLGDPKLQLCKGANAWLGWKERRAFAGSL